MANRLLRGANAGLVANRQLAEMLHDLREARIRHGLRQRDLARALRTSVSSVGRVERGELERIGVPHLARHAELVGLHLSVKLFPSGGRLRDAKQLQMMNRYRDVTAEGRWGYLLEVRVGDQRDLRAVDLVMTRSSLRIAHEFISRLRDVQAQVRPILRKKEDGGFSRLILVIAATRANRQAVLEAGPILRTAFPLGTRQVLAALRRGEDPGADGLVFL